MAQNIVIYQDEGVGEFGLSCLLEFFKGDNVRLADAGAVIDGTVLENAAIFVMPGGADLPYCRKLNGKGNMNIRAFVENGGTYLGICAGAYYACKAIEYHKGRKDEICQPRELALLDAVAVGSIFEIAQPFNENLSSAAITNVNGIPAFYFGGPYFKTSADTAATYDALNYPAIIRGKYGKGLVVLSGIHFEVTPYYLEKYPTNDDFEKQMALELAQKLRYAPSFDWNNFLLGVKE